MLVGTDHGRGGHRDESEPAPYFPTETRSSSAWLSFAWFREGLDSTAARDHGFRVEGLYALEDRVFEEAGIRRPKEGRWDLVFQTFLLSLLLVFGLCMAGLTLVFLMSWDIHLNYDAGGSANAHITLPEVSWVYYAMFTVLVLAAFYLLLRRLIAAWKKRSRNASG